jgi:NADH dehydrogenase
MNFIILGGGRTGVELAGALVEIKKGILAKDYPHLDTRRAQINLKQLGNHILKKLNKRALQKIGDSSEALGVRIWKNTGVKSYDSKLVTTAIELSFEAATLVRTIVVKSIYIKDLDTQELLTKSTNIQVNKFNQIIGHENIFAIGDIAEI